MGAPRGIELDEAVKVCIVFKDLFFEVVLCQGDNVTVVGYRGFRFKLGHQHSLHSRLLISVAKEFFNEVFDLLSCNRPDISLIEMFVFSLSYDDEW